MKELFASEGMELSVLNELVQLFGRAAGSGYAKRDVRAVYEYLKGAMSL
jgi:3-hydroxyisobutyrate dehydrogenase-like beta-hydroxyacid dehydrogenase